jgi:hypothetical protein
MTSHANWRDPSSGFFSVGVDCAAAGACISEAAAPPKAVPTISDFHALRLRLRKTVDIIGMKPFAVRASSLAPSCLAG